MTEYTVRDKVIPRPMQSLIDYMITNKIQCKVINIKDKSKYNTFIKDVKIAIDKKLIRIKLNPIKHSELWVSLGPVAQKMIEY